MRRHVLLALPLAVLAGTAPRAQAEVPPLSDAELLAQSTHVVVGGVQGHYTRPRAQGPEHRDDVVVTEILVSKAEKGDGLQDGKTLYVRSWHATTRPEGWAGPSGLNVSFPVGAGVRLFLRRDDKGGFDVLTPNGVQIIDWPPAAVREKPESPSPSTAAPPTLAETADSLRYEVSLLLAVAREGDAAKTKAALAPWFLPDAKAWFVATYGTERGSAGAEEYAKQTSSDALDGQLRFLVGMSEHSSETGIEGGPATDETSGTQVGKAMARMVKPVPLWYARASGKSLQFFVFDGGRWRIAGKMRAAWEN